MAGPEITETGIAGLLLVENIPVMADERGSFRSPWRADFPDTRLQGLDFKQFNVSVSNHGVIRGIHAEPWDKYVHVVNGMVFSAIVDLRSDQSTFGHHRSFELDQTKALLIPKGCGNSFLVTSEVAHYGYLTTSLWFPDNPYPAVSLFDQELGINWPLPEDRWVVSDKDRRNPSFREAYP